MTTATEIKSSAASPPPGAIHPLADLESTIPTILEALQVPGLTVSVFKNGEQLLHRGFGTRIAGRDDTPVNTDTLFDLCSVTKHITAAAAAKLVHDGKLQWNEPVTKHIPQWQFSDPNLTKSVTMVDLLSHRTGLAGHNEMQMGNRNGNLAAGHRDPADFLPHLALGNQFRSSFIYSNLCFALATRVIEQVSGQAFPDFVAEHLFDPLGIKDYEWCYRAFANHPNAALPHVWRRPDTLQEYAEKHVYGSEKTLEDRIAELEKVESPEAGLAMCKANPIELEAYLGFPEDLRDAVGAGVFYVSANGMVKWAQCLINEGKAPDGKTQVVHELDTIFKIHNPTSYTAESEAPPRYMRPLGYGLGMGIQQFGEYNVLAHDGGMPGVMTQLVLVPRAKIFIYLASNAINGLLSPFTNLILHTLLPPAGSYPAPYTRDNLYKTLPAIKLEYPLYTAMAIKALVGPTWPVPKDQVPPLACDPLDLAGTYFHPGYGYATVLADAHTGKLRLVRARNEVDVLHRVTAAGAAESKPVDGLAFFTFTESPLRVRFVKDESVKDTRPLPKHKAGFAWREKCKYRMVMTEGTAQLDIVFERVDF